ncbi:MAG: lysophospholipid acyltransferase family protein [Sandaracinaceae bacterium]
MKTTTNEAPSAAKASAGQSAESPRPRAPARSFEKPSAAERVVSAGLWSLGLGFLAPSLGAMTVVYKFVPAHRVNILGRLYCKGQIALTGNRWKAVVHPDVDPNTSYLFTQNHTNHYDHVMLYNATPHFKQGIELEDHFKYPFYGWFMKARGTIPVRRGERGQTSSLVRGMQAEIDGGRSILAFPEGTRSRDGHVGPFKHGIFYAAVDCGVPIVPVSVTGSFDLMRPGSLMLRPGNDITVYCDKPIPTAGLTAKDVPDLADRVRAVIDARIEAYWEEQQR